MLRIRELTAIRGIALLLFLLSRGPVSAQAPSASSTPSPASSTAVVVVVYANPFPGQVIFYNDKGKQVTRGTTGTETLVERGKYYNVVIARDGIFSCWKGEVGDYDFKIKWSEKYEFSPKQRKVIKWGNIFWSLFFLSAVTGGFFGYTVFRRMRDMKKRLKEAASEGTGETGRIPKKIGTYSVIEKLGHGGMATVYKVRDEHGDIYALKVPHSHIFDVPEFRSRFMREVDIIKTLHHPNIVRMYDYDLDENTPTPYICFEYVEGESMKDFLDKNPLLPIQKAVEMTISIASALGYAHSKGITHRDVKPENVMISVKQQIKLMDLGIARAMKFKTLTATGTTLGTPQYIAPEQVARVRKDIDGRADLYSLGVMLYEMVTGKIPFDDEEPMMVIMMHVAEAPPSPRTHNALIPEGLEMIILKLMEKSPDDRYQTADELIEELKCFQ